MKNVVFQTTAIAICLTLLAGFSFESSRASALTSPAGSAASFGISELQNERDKKEAASIQKAVGKKMNFYESAHFTWASVLTKGKMTKIINEAEKCYEIFAKEAGYKDHRKLWFQGRKCMGVILGSKRGYKKYVKWYSETYPVWSKKGFVQNHAPGSHLNESAQRNVMATHLKPHTEIQVASVMCHLVGHLCIDRHAYNNNFTPGWLRECMGAYFQLKVHGRLRVGSYDDPYGVADGDEDRQKGLKPAAMKARVKKSVTGHKLRNSKAFFELATLRELNFLDIQKGHLMLSWMLKKKGAFASFLKAMKQKWPANIVQENTKGKTKAQIAALKKAYGVTPEELDQALEAFSKSGY